MLRQLLILFFLACQLSLQAQYGIQLSNFYPRTMKVPAKVFEQFDKQIYSGCDEGNCRQGEGVWLEIIAEGYGRTVADPVNQRKAWLIYRVTKGTFLEEGRICRGQQTLVYVPLERSSSQVDYLPVNYGHRVDTSTADLIKGDFTQSSNGYYTDDEVELGGVAKRYGYKKVKLITRSETIHYASVDYADGDSVRSFAGLVDENLRPVYGVGTLRNGSVFNGFFIKNKTGPGYLFKNAAAVTGTPQDGAGQLDFLPDLGLLKKLFSQKYPVKNFELNLGWGSADQERESGMPVVALSRDLGRWTAGWLMGEDGLPQNADYTGKGIYFYNARQFYFGSFTKGIPDGKGSFYKRHIGGMWIDINKAPVFLKTGLYTRGTFTAGHFVYEEAGAMYSKALPLSPIVEPLFTDLAKAANANDAGALLLLGEKYLTGISVSPDLVKALRYLDRALIFGNAQAAARLGELYLNGSASLSVKADKEKAMEYYLKGAQLNETVHATKTAIENCKSKYLLLKYPFLNAALASRFTLDDEFNLGSELNRYRQEYSDRLVTGATSASGLYTEAEKQSLVGKLFFKRTSYKSSKNNWTNYTVFYKVMSVDGDKLKLTRSSTTSTYIENDWATVDWFMNAKKNGLIEATQKYSQCGNCSGSGVVAGRASYKHTSDYQYTLGVKITTTATVATREECPFCKGAGFCPTNGSAPEWVWKY